MKNEFKKNKSLLSNDNTSSTLLLQGKKKVLISEVSPYQRIKEVQKKKKYSTLQCTLLVFLFLRLQTLGIFVRWQVKSFTRCAYF